MELLPRGLSSNPIRKCQQVDLFLQKNMRWKWSEREDEREKRLTTEGILLRRFWGIGC